MIDVNDLGDEVPEPEATVILACDSTRAAIGSVVFLDVSEGFFGDVLRFECPKCGRDHESLIYG